VANSLVARGCAIQGTVEKSVLFPGVRIEKGARVRDTIIMQDAVVGEGCQVEYAILDKLCVLGPKAAVGVDDASVPNLKFPTHLECGISVIGKSAVIPPGIRIGKNCIIGPRVDLRTRGLTQVAAGETIVS
jgi:glucose-1-phosphate adenylyltransferase